MKERFDYNNIDDFLRGKLNENEKQSFYNGLQKEKELQQAYNFYSKTSQLVKMKAVLKEVEGDLEGRGFFDEFKTNRERKAPASAHQTRIFTLKRSFAIAASICLLIVAGMLGYAQRHYSNAALASIDEGKMVMYSTFRGTNKAKKVDSFQDGVLALQKKDYLSAIRLFEAVLTTKKGKKKKETQLYLAYALFEKGDLINAKEAVAPLLESEVLSIRQKAEWLKVQILLTNNDLNATFFELLDKIATEYRHVYQKEAQQLQQKMNSFWRRMIKPSCGK